MRTFKVSTFERFARKARITDLMLCQAIRLVLCGQVNADLGGGVIKQRLARAGEGKSGGYRVIIVFQRGANAFFVHGFAKSDTANISPRELKALKTLAKDMLALNADQIAVAIQDGELVEVFCND